MTRSWSRWRADGLLPDGQMSVCTARAAGLQAANLAAAGHQDQCPLHRTWGFSQARSGAASELSMLPGAAFKVYVNVFVEHTTEGLMLPRTIVWEDGLKYDNRPSD